MKKILKKFFLKIILNKNFKNIETDTCFKRFGAYKVLLNTSFRKKNYES